RASERQAPGHTDPCCPPTPPRKVKKHKRGMEQRAQGEGLRWTVGSGNLAVRWRGGWSHPGGGFSWSCMRRLLLFYFIYVFIGFYPPTVFTTQTWTFLHTFHGLLHTSTHTPCFMYLFQKMTFKKG